MNKYDYPAEKFVNARTYLEASRVDQTTKAITIADAFRECRQAMFQLDKPNVDYLNDGVMKTLMQLRKLMDTSGIQGRPDDNLDILRAEQLTSEEILNLEGMVNYLANWFDSRARE